MFCNFVIIRVTKKIMKIEPKLYKVFIFKNNEELCEKQI